MKQDFIGFLDSLSVHINAIESLTIAVIGLVDAEERDYAVVASTLKHHTDKARELVKAQAEQYRKEQKYNGRRK